MMKGSNICIIKVPKEGDKEWCWSNSEETINDNFKNEAKKKKSSQRFKKNYKPQADRHRENDI